MAETGELSSLTVGLLVGAVSLLLLKLWQTYNYMRTFKKMGIPGPRPLPVIGNMLPFNRRPIKDVFEEWNKQFGKVYGVFFPDPTLVVWDLDIVRDVLVKKFPVFSNRTEFPGFSTDEAIKDNLVSINGEHWKHVRSQLSPTFSSNKLKKVFPTIQKVAKNLCQRLQNVKSTEDIELRELCRNVTMDVIAGVAFGLEVDSIKNSDDSFYKHGENMINCSQGRFKLFATFPFLDKILMHLGFSVFPKSDTSYLLRVIDAALQERRLDKQMHSDFLQLMVEAEKVSGDQVQIDADIDFKQQLDTSDRWTRKGLTVSEIHANSLIFLFAGYDVVANAMSLCLFSLAAHPDCLQQACEEVDTKLGKSVPNYESAANLTYIDMCLNETIRLYVTNFLDRKSSEDFEFGGHHVPKGTRILIPSAAIHCDPDLWPDPLKFNPDRFTPEARAQRHPFAFMPFGLGPRNCIGMRLAQLEIKIMIASTLQRFTPVLCQKSVHPPVLKPFSNIARDDLWVRFQPREAVIG